MLSDSLPKYGLITDPSKDVLAQIEVYAKDGCDYIEIGIEEPMALPAMLIRQKAQILDNLEKYKIFAIGHTAYWVEFGSMHEKVRRGWVEEAKEMINAAHELNMNLLNFHFEAGHGLTFMTDFGKKEFTDNFISSMNELTSFSKDKNIRLMLENTPPVQRKKVDIEDYSKVIENVEGLAVHLDVAHAFIEGGMDRIGDYISRFSGNIAHIHAHDNNGKEDEHLPIGRGSIDFNQVVDKLKGTGYNNTVTFEVFSSHEDAVKSMKLFKELWG